MKPNKVLYIDNLLDNDEFSALVKYYVSWWEEGEKVKFDYDFHKWHLDLRDMEVIENNGVCQIVNIIKAPVFMKAKSFYEKDMFYQLYKDACIRINS